MTLDAVLPLVSADFDRTRRLLLPSLAAHAADLSRIFVVVPDASISQARSVLAGPYPFELIFLRESQVVPEERLFLVHRRGWWLQQLIKLAMADWVRGDFYLLLDCDLLCNRSWTVGDLVWDGKAVLQRDTLRPDENLAWYTQASRVLKLPLASAAMSVTPVVFSSAGVAAMTEHLRRQVPTWLQLISRGARPGLRQQLGGWRLHLRRNIPWTEMSLYITYLEAHDLVRQHHHETWDAVLYGNNVWNRQQFDAWNPAASVGAPFLFTVVGSKCGASVDEVLAKLSGFA